MPTFLICIRFKWAAQKTQQVPIKWQKIPLTCQLEQNWKLATDTSEKKKATSSRCSTKMADHMQDTTLSNQTYPTQLTLERVLLNFLILAISSAENAGWISLLICFTLQAIRTVLQHSRRGSQVSPSSGKCSWSVKLSQKMGAEHSAELSVHQPVRMECLTNVCGKWNPRLGHRTADPLPEGPWCVATLLPWKAAVGPHHLYSVTRLHFIHQVIIENDIHRARKLTGRGLLWHLLDGDGLVVLVDRQAILCLQRVVFFILQEKKKKKKKLF